jgi:hypothetical protein
VLELNILLFTCSVLCLFCCTWQGEAYKLFWPDQPEFVRMAARFGVTIIPFGCVGEDDFLEVAFCDFVH